jgi:hypothetical protein
VPSASSATAVAGTKRGSGSSASSATAAKQPRVGTRFVPVLTNEQESLLAAFVEEKKWVGHLRVATFGRASEDNKKKNVEGFVYWLNHIGANGIRKSEPRWIIDGQANKVISGTAWGKKPALHHHDDSHTPLCMCLGCVCVSM